MRINHNISALKTNNILGKNNSALEKSLERLSSGYRINCAADDAAGLAISQKMKTQIAGLNQASRNAADGISVIQTAEGALIEVSEMLQRMRELSVQAANGTSTDDDRSQLQAEVDQLKDEINRISETTEFNTKKLLDGTVDRRSYSSDSNVELISLSDSVGVKAYSFKVGDNQAQSAVILGSAINGTTFADEVKMTINKTDVVIPAGSTMTDAISIIRDKCSTMGIQTGLTDGTADAAGLGGYKELSANPDIPANSRLIFVTNDKGTNAELQIDAPQGLADMLGLKTSAKDIGTDCNITLLDGFSNTATVSVDGDLVTVKDRDDFEMVFRVSGGVKGIDGNDDGDLDDLTPVDTNQNNVIDEEEKKAVDQPGVAVVTVLDAGPMTLQIGANEGQTMEVRIPRVDTTTLGIDEANIGTQAGAMSAITLFENAIREVSSTRSKLGAYQNRLDHAINSLDVSAENLTEALSRIEDTDMASEMATFTQYQVLTQAATSMLAQANERPQNILNLLQS